VSAKNWHKTLKTDTYASVYHRSCDRR